MIFPDWKRALNGRKTEVRVPAKDRCRFRPGNDYAVTRKTGETKPVVVRRKVKDEEGKLNIVRSEVQWPVFEEVGRIMVLAVDRQKLGDISAESVKREGHQNRNEFVEQWCQRYGEFVPELEVWAIFFQLHTDIVRIPARDSTRGYVSSRQEALGRVSGRTAEEFYLPEAEPELESVSLETQERFTEDARERFESRMPLSERVRELEGKLRPEQWNSLRTRVERLEKAARKEAA